MDGPRITQTLYKKPYAALEPSRPELSQDGRTILITGGNDGIGYAAALAFGQADASRVIIAGRRPEATRAAAGALEAQLQGGNTSFVGATCDIIERGQVEQLWAGLEAEGVAVDVLVLNATGISAQQSILERGAEGIWQDLDINVRAQLDLTERFYQQNRATSSAGTATGRKHLVMLSTMAAHDFDAPAPPGYGLTKNAGTLLMQLIAKDTPPEDMQIVSFHPGAVYTHNAKISGWKEDDLDWTDASLPGQFAVWAASSEATFLHGRFVHSSWDVEELKGGQLRNRIDEDQAFLRVGIHGL